MSSAQRGFTLIELMIVVVVMTVLLAIAIPSYQENVRRSRRVEAQVALVSVQQAMERFFTLNNTYTGASLTGANPIFPANVPSSGPANYVLSLAIVAAGNNYTITATRQGAQAADECGNFNLAASGARSLTGASKTLQQCWP